MSMALGRFGLRNWLVADEFELIPMKDFAVEVDDVRSDRTVNIERLGRIFTIWVGLFVEFVYFPDRRGWRGGGPVFLELQETALELGDGTETNLRVLAEFGDGAIPGEGFLGG